MLKIMQSHKFFTVFVLSAITIMISVAFIFWGIGPKDSAQVTYVASVENEKIPLDEYWRAYDNEVKRLKKENKSPVKTKRISAYQADPGVKPARKKIDTTLDWLRYQRHGSVDTRARLLKKYLPLVRNVAGRMAIGFPRSVELSDLINTGVIGLVEAFKNYDPDRGVKFETYAVPRIRGAILDELRALDWVPRSTRAKSREIDRAQVKLENMKGRPAIYTLY